MTTNERPPGTEGLNDIDGNYYIVVERDEYDELIFRDPVDQTGETGELDRINNQLTEEYGDQTEIDWRDDVTCWVHFITPDTSWIDTKDPIQKDLIVEYLVESAHQGWEGWSRDELAVLHRLNEDMKRYVELAMESKGHE